MPLVSFYPHENIRKPGVFLMFSGVIERDQRYYGLTTRSEKKIREVVDMDAIQFGFMLGKGTMDAIFIARQLQERFFF